MSIATRTGDDGSTSLCFGERVSKTHERIQMVGALDELNAHLGTINPEFFDLSEVQNELFDLGWLMVDMKTKKTFEEPLNRIDKAIQDLESEIPPLTQFILPGGHPEAAKIHVARTVARRAEREMCEIETLPEFGYKYLNRLSDYLFLAARKVNFDSKTAEPTWKSVL